MCTTHKIITLLSKADTSLNKSFEVRILLRIPMHSDPEGIKFTNDKQDYMSNLNHSLFQRAVFHRECGVADKRRAIKGI